MIKMQNNVVMMRCVATHIHMLCIDRGYQTILGTNTLINMCSYIQSIALSFESSSHDMPVLINYLTAQLEFSYRAESCAVILLFKIVMMLASNQNYSRVGIQ